MFLSKSVDMMKNLCLLFIAGTFRSTKSERGGSEFHDLFCSMAILVRFLKLSKHLDSTYTVFTAGLISAFMVTRHVMMRATTRDPFKGTGQVIYTYTLEVAFF